MEGWSLRFKKCRALISQPLHPTRLVSSDPTVSPETLLFARFPNPLFVDSTMSCSNACYHASNNKHFKCPPRMDDGRHFTDYRPNCYMNNLVQESGDIHNSTQMRMYLTHNAVDLMQLNRRKACDRNCCGPCQKPYQSGTMMPEASAEVSGMPIPCGTKSSQPSLVSAYSDAPLTCSAWNTGDSREVSYNCCSTVQNLANTYPTSADGVVVSRKSVPGGGMPMQ